VKNIHINFFTQRFSLKQKVLTAETVRTHCFYSDKHINVNIVPIQNSMLFIIRKEELFSTISKQCKIAGFDVFPNYLFAIAACTVDSVAITIKSINGYI